MNKNAIVFGFIILLFSSVYLVLSHERLMMDERLHMNQITRFVHGDFTISTELSMGPGYHLLLTPFGRILGTAPATLRLMQLFISFAFLFIFWKTANLLDQKYAKIKLLQVALCPLLFPYYFLLYTDSLTLLLLVASFALVIKRRYGGAGLLASASLLVRQTSIIWLGYILLTAYVQERNAKKFATFFIGIAGFVLFIIINGGVVTGAKSFQPVAPSINNIVLFLFLMFMLFLPEHIARVRKYVFFLPGILLVGLLLTSFFANNHPWNQTPYFLRNQLLIWFSQDTSHKLLLFSLAGIQLVALASQPLVTLFGMLSLGFISLVEPRYGLPFLTFYLLTRSIPSVRAAYTTLPIFLFLSLYQIWGLHTDRFFP
ncbi:hypothetical protein HY086_03665 [Candidatus Gottesmanbacteria bacterium]|nr:hypothetical protein [Candidatus Gottesmanbacteria bacterium]